MALEYADWIRNNTRIFTDWVNLFLLKGKYTCMEIILKWRSLWIRMQSKRAKLKVNVIFMLTPFKYALFLRSEVKSQDEQERWSIQTLSLVLPRTDFSWALWKVLHVLSLRARLELLFYRSEVREGLCLWEGLPMSERWAANVWLPNQYAQFVEVRA